MPSRPSSMTPSGSPIAPIAVVSSPGIVRTCTPVVSRRATTERICSSLAPGVMTIITGANATEPLRAAADAHAARGDGHVAGGVARGDDRGGAHRLAARQQVARGAGDADLDLLALAGRDAEVGLTEHPAAARAAGGAGALALRGGG